MKINWKGQGRQIHGDLVLDWYLQERSNPKPFCGTVFVSEYVIWNCRTGRTILAMVVK